MTPSGPDDLDAKPKVSGVQEGLGRAEDALAALEMAIASRGNYVAALVNLTALLRRTGRLETAVANCRRVLELEPENYTVHATLGSSLQDLGRLAEAEASYRQALTFNPQYTEARANLAEILRMTGRNEEALGLLFDLVAEAPGDIQLRRMLAFVLSDFQIVSAGEKVRGVLLSLCKDDMSTKSIIPSIIALLKSEKGFRVLQENTRLGKDPFAPLAPAVARFLSEPLLLEALPRMAMGDASIEQVLTHLRRCILLRAGLAPAFEALHGAVPTQFVLALVRHCLLSGYVFIAREDEVKIVATLREAVEERLRSAIIAPCALELPLAVVALYEPLHKVKGHQQLAERTTEEWSEGFRPIVREQIENRRREREIAGQIRPLTGIADRVSLAVRAQYEENPYPRWVTVASPNPDTIEDLIGRLRPGQVVRPRPRPVPILVAGCGTGHHCIQVARAYPDSEILAVDLSLTSLAYAARMSEQLGIRNIVYRQADILGLGEVRQRFALIECSGVLHHLDEPLAGWRVLVQLLESDGVMKIGLYSKKARTGIQAAREFAASLGAPATPDGIRRCRDAISRLPDGHPARGVMGIHDFFTLDGCRDLIMHVQEHQFTISKLQACLDELHLQFLGFETAPTTMNRFKELFPDEGSELEFASWQQFEDAYPETFI